MLAIVGQHSLRFAAVRIAARARLGQAIAGLPFARGQLGDVLLALRLVAVVQDRQGADARMRSDRHTETVPGTGHFRHQHRRHEVLAEAPEVLRHRYAQQPQFACLVQQARHQAFFQRVDAVQLGPHVLLQELPRALRDHPLFLVEFLGNEDVLRCALADQELAALEGFLRFSAHGSCRCGVLRMYRTSRSP